MKITLKPLAEQVILITGASSGIGLVTAKLAASRGAKVMLVARNDDALANAAKEIEAAGGAAAYAVADVGDAGQVRDAAAAAVARFGRIDTWVNNAGVAIYARLAETPLDEHERMFRTNYFGAVNGATAALTHLRGGGALITVGSVASDIPSPIMGAYAATKHAVKAYIESLRIELAADKLPISITLVKPAGIDTPIAQHAANHQPGEAVIPPPTYDPTLVAEAILDAAVHPRREITVGGVGRAQVLFATHFPALFERLAPMMIPILADKTQRKTPSDTLFSTAEAGRERSGVSAPRKTSLYTASQLHPLASLTLGAVAVGGLAALLATRSRRA